MSHGFEVKAEALGKDRHRVALWNGRLVHIDALTLASAISRGRFTAAAAKKLVDQHNLTPEQVDAARSTIEQLLVELAANLPKTSAPEREAQVRGAQDRADEPWPDPVNGAEVLDEICLVLSDYIMLPPWAAEVLALWLVHTYVPDVGNGYTPYIFIGSPVRECGKTTLLELLFHLAWRANMTGGITAAALYRRIDRVAPTMLIDEIDARLRGEGGESLRGILNTGFHKLGVHTICVGDDHEDRDFRTFCPKVLAGIGQPWDTVLSRSIPIRLKRASAEERAALKKIRGDHIAKQLEPLRRKLLRYAKDRRDLLSVTDVPPPDELTARQGDIWRPLLAIAHVAGAGWLDKAKQAAVAIHKAAPEETDRGLLLLEDLRQLFKEDGGCALFSKYIVEKLVDMDGRPWPEYTREEKPIKEPGVARLLKRFEVKSKTVRRGSEQAKGYHLDDLAPVFRCYLPDPTPRSAVPAVPNQENTAKPRENTAKTWDGSWDGSQSAAVPTVPRAVPTGTAGTDGTARNPQPSHEPSQTNHDSSKDLGTVGTAGTDNRDTAFDTREADEDPNRPEGKGVDWESGDE